MAPKPRKKLRTGGLQHGLMLVGELDEDIFEAGSERTNLGDGNAVLQELFAEIVEIETILDKRVDGLSENRGAADAGEMARKAERAVTSGVVISTRIVPGGWTSGSS